MAPSGAAAANEALAPTPAADGMPEDLLLACTATSIHAFGYKLKGAAKVQITSTYATRDRAGLVVTSEPAGRMTQRLRPAVAERRRGRSSTPSCRRGSTTTSTPRSS